MNGSTCVAGCVTGLLRIAVLLGAAGSACGQSLEVNSSTFDKAWNHLFDVAFDGEAKVGSTTPSGAASTGATARFGIVRSSASVIVDAGAPGAPLARSDAAGRDWITVNAPGLEFTQGTLVVRVGLQGALDAVNQGGADADAFLRYNFNLSGCPAFFTTGDECHLRGLPGGGSEFNGTQLVGTVREFTTPVLFGAMMELSLNVASESTANGSFAGQPRALADLMIRWGGIIEVRDADGNIVTGVTVSSASGFDYLGVAPPACPADLNLDGQTSLDDLFAFLNAFDAGDFAADIEAVPGVDLNDFFVFLNSFDQGCN